VSVLSLDEDNDDVVVDGDDGAAAEVAVGAECATSGDAKYVVCMCIGCVCVCVCVCG